MVRVTSLRTFDLRSPTSRTLAGSDAVHVDPDYSAAYVVLETDVAGLRGSALSFTIGAGNDLVKATIDALGPMVVGCSLDDVVHAFGAYHRSLTNHPQLRWLGPDKGTYHLAVGAVVNAWWDLWARSLELPVWKLVASLSPEQLVSCLDLRYLSDVLTADAALAILREARPGLDARERSLLATGYPAYLTSAGWLGYAPEKVRALTNTALDEGWTSFKTKVGVSVESDLARVELMRGLIGDGSSLMADANQVWDVGQAIEWTSRLAPYRLRWIEEPTSPDDVLGHAAIRRALRERNTGIGVATGEHAMNKVLFKQLFQAEAIDYCQIDMCRLAGLNEVLAVQLMARVFDVPVCPHAGGIGLCEYVQHASVIDHVVLGAPLTDRTVEYAGHGHEYFVDPVTVRNGAYVVPQRPGFSVELHDWAIDALRWPNGSVWTDAP